MYYKAEYGGYQENSGFREAIPRVICPICPVFLGEKWRNSLRDKALLFVLF
jgi:hypothetical protein